MKKNKTGLVAALVIATLAAAAYFALRGKNKGGGGGGGNTSGGGETTPGLNFQSMADTIFEEMDGYGTGFNDIMTQLKKLKTKADWDALVAAYGTRTVSSGNFNIFVSDYTGDLAGALNSELRSGQIDDVNELLEKFGASI